MPHDAAWLKEHLATIGGTGATIVAGVNRFTSPEDYWWRLKRARSGELPAFEQSPDQKRGTYYEAIVRKLINDEPAYDTSIDPHPQDDFCYHPDMPWAHCLPDGWATTQRMDASGRPIREEVVAEIKVPRPEVFRKIHMTGLTDEYMVQSQHNMMVLDFDCLYFAIMNPVTLDCITQLIYRDFAFTDQLAEREQRFFASLDGDAPPAWLESKPSADPFTEDDLEIPETKGAAVVIKGDDAQGVVAAVTLAEAYMDKKYAEATYKLAKDAYLSHVNNAPLTQAPGIITAAHFYKTKPRETLNKAAALKRHPDLKDLLTTGEPSEAFRLYIDPDFAARSR